MIASNNTASNNDNVPVPVKFSKYRKAAYGYNVRSAGGIRGVTENEIQVTLGAVQTSWITGKGQLPGVADILQQTQFPEWKVLAILADPEFRTRCTLRGIPWPKNWNRVKHDSAVVRSRLTPDQVMTLQIVTDPTNKRPLGSKLRQAGITYATWRNWMRDQAFADAVKTTAEEMLQDMVPATHARVANKADAGDLKAVEMLYQLTGRYDPAKQQMLEMTTVVRLLLEIISRHVTDPVALKQITTEVDLVLQGETLKELDQLPANYVPQVKEANEPVPEGFFELDGFDQEGD